MEVNLKNNKVMTIYRAGNGYILQSHEEVEEYSVLAYNTKSIETRLAMMYEIRSMLFGYLFKHLDAPTDIDIYAQWGKDDSMDKRLKAWLKEEYYEVDEKLYLKLKKVFDDYDDSGVPD